MNEKVSSKQKKQCKKYNIQLHTDFQLPYVKKIGNKTNIL